MVKWQKGFARTAYRKDFAKTINGKHLNCLLIYLSFILWKKLCLFWAGRQPYLRAPENQLFLGSPLPQTKPQFMVAFKLASTIGKNSLI
jgi:hypothetical protein